MPTDKKTGDVCGREYAYEAFCCRPKGHAGRCHWKFDPHEYDLTHPDDLMDEAAGAGAWCECGAPLPCPDCLKGGDDR